MAVDVEVSEIAVQALAHEVGHVTESQDIRRVIERQPVFIGQSVARTHFFQNRAQARIFDDGLHSQMARVRSKISAAQNRKNNTLT